MSFDGTELIADITTIGATNYDLTDYKGILLVLECTNCYGTNAIYTKEQITALMNHGYSTLTSFGSYHDSYSLGAVFFMKLNAINVIDFKLGSGVTNETPHLKVYGIK